MTKRKTQKRALLASCMSMLLCVAMLVGSTFAWFTDTAVSSNNKIESGKLDIKLYQVENTDMWTNVEDMVKTEITESSDPIFGDDIIWEPGYIAVANLWVENAGNLAAKLKATLVATSDIGALADQIEVYVENGHIPVTNGDKVAREDLTGMEWNHPTLGTITIGGATCLGTLREVINGQTLINGKSGDEIVLEAGDYTYFGIALKMKETAGNEYQEATAGTFDIRVVATQATVESDSYDNQYDAGAEYPAVIHGQAALTEALKNAEAGDTVVLAAGTYELPAGVAEGVSVIGLEGVKVTLPQPEGPYDRLNTTDAYFENITFVDSVCLTGAATFKNCVFELGTDTCTANGDITFEGCTFNSNGNGDFALHIDSGDKVSTLTVKDCTFMNGAIAYKNIASATFDNCDFYGGWGWKYMRIYCDTVINDSRFACKETDNSVVAPATLTCNNVTWGVVYVSEDNEADLGSVQNGGTVVLGSGNYELGNGNASAALDGATIIGNGNTVIESINETTNCTFENVIVKDIYTLQNSTLIDCVVEAPVNDVACATRLLENSTFKGCTFTANGAGTSLWLDDVTDGKSVTFEDCVFVDNIRLGGDETNSYTFKNCQFLGGKVNWSKALIITYAPATFDTCTFTVEGEALYGIRLAQGMTAEDITLIDTNTNIMVP